MVKSYLQSFISLAKTICYPITFILILTLTGLYFFQDKMLYIPIIPGTEKSPEFNPMGYRNPGEYNLDFEDIETSTQDKVKIRGWFIKGKNYSNQYTVIFFHENAGSKLIFTLNFQQKYIDLGTRLTYFNEYVTRTNFNIIAFAYRGYSKSDGNPSEKGIQKDSIAILKYAMERNDINKSKIILHGRSLGGAVAIYGLNSNLGKELKVQGLIIENSFFSIAQMVDKVFPALKIFKRLVLRNHWKSGELISNLTCKILFIFSMKDELVPPQQMAMLFDAAKKSQFKTKHIIEQGNHNSGWSEDIESYFNSIQNFVSSNNPY